VGFERTGSETIWEGKMGSLRVDRFRYDDGEEVEREIFSHPGAVAVVAHDGEKLFMVRQPREAVDEQALLELPAGKLEEDEDVEARAKRELAEEIGKAARSWEFLKRFYSSPGFAAEEIDIYLATDLYDESAEAGEEERIEVVEVPLDRLDDAIRDCRDGKSLVGLLWFRTYHR
jgi:8-oxo-dGTP pyrophosphatase MutT (NUDIX family)